MRRTAGEQCARPPSPEAGAERPGRWQETWESESGEPDRVPRNAKGAEEIAEQLVRRVQEGSEELLVGARVFFQLTRRLVQRASQEHGRLVIERMGDGGERGDPAQPVLVERQGPEKWRQDPHGMTAGAHVVHEPGERELGGPDPSADLVPSLEDSDGCTRPRELDGGGESVRTRADDDGVVHDRQLSP